MLTTVIASVTQRMPLPTDAQGRERVTTRAGGRSPATSRGGGRGRDAHRAVRALPARTCCRCRTTPPSSSPGRCTSAARWSAVSTARCRRPGARRRDGPRGWRRRQRARAPAALRARRLVAPAGAAGSAAGRRPTTWTLPGLVPGLRAGRCRAGRSRGAHGIATGSRGRDAGPDRRRRHLALGGRARRARAPDRRQPPGVRRRPDRSRLHAGEHRGRGYASAAVAEVSRPHVDQGVRCCLFTDQANPVSNHIYEAIGYRPVVDMVNLLVT